MECDLVVEFRVKASRLTDATTKIRSGKKAFYVRQFLADLSRLTGAPTKLRFFIVGDISKIEITFCRNFFHAIGEFWAFAAHAAPIVRLQ